MNLKSRYKRLGFWNKVAFWGSLASILAIFLWVFDRKSNEWRNQEYLPAREAVVAAIFQSYNSLNIAAQYVIAPGRVSSSVRITPRQEFLTTKWSLDPVEHDLKKAEAIVIRNNIALDPQSVSLVSAFMDDARSLQKHLAFFAQLYDPKMSKWDFVSTGPFAKFARVDSVINELRKQYPQISLGGDLKQANELETLWKDVERTNGRLCLRVGEYVWKTDRLPMVFDRNDLVQLSTPTFPNYQAKTYVYDLNE